MTPFLLRTNDIDRHQPKATVIDGGVDRKYQILLIGSNHCLLLLAFSDLSQRPKAAVLAKLRGVGWEICGDRR